MKIEFEDKETLVIKPETIVEAIALDWWLLKNITYADGKLLVSNIIFHHSLDKEEE